LLEDFANHFGIGQHKQVVLAIDQDSFHVSDKVRIPEGIHLLFLPAKSPELQPAERLWPLTNEAIANSTFASFDDLEEATVQRCRVLRA
jgi:transposase